MLRTRLTYANVVATLALFVALGGSSYAAITVTGKNVKNSSLTGKDIKNNSLTGSDVKGIKSGDVSDGSLLARDFKAGQLPAGAQGIKGEKGDPGTARAYAHVLANGTVDAARSKNVDRVLRFEDGGYCVNFTFGAPNVVVVTPETGLGQAAANAGDSACNVGGLTYNAQVYTSGITGTQVDRDFFLLAN
jgi:hypothetical protein